MALLRREPARAHQRRHQDLVVDLVIRAVDAARVVDGVGVDAHAGEARLDARRLGEAEIAALGDDARSAARARRSRTGSLARSPTSAFDSVEART